MKDTRLGRADKNKPGLYENIRAKRERIEAGSGERMRKPGQKGAPAASDFKAAAKTVKPEEKEDMGMRSKYDKMKKGCDCKDGSKGSCKCSKKDMGGMKKSPYADGCGYKEDAFARELDAVISGVKLDGMGVKKLSKPGPDDEDDRDDKKCGASGIADNKKCTKGAGAQAPRSAQGSIRRRALQGVKLGAKIGGGIGAVQGAALGSRFGGPAGAAVGALTGGASGALGGALQGGVVGGIVGAVEKGTNRRANKPAPRVTAPQNNVRVYQGVRPSQTTYALTLKEIDALAAAGKRRRQQQGR
jgi:hypothetical protein